MRGNLRLSLEFEPDFNTKINVLWYYKDDILVAIEEFLGMFFVGAMSIVGFGDRAKSQYGLGIAFEYSSGTWKADIIPMMKNAKFIALIPWGSSGVLWEINRIVISEELLRKTVMLIPNFDLPWNESQSAEMKAEFDRLDTVIKSLKINFQTEAAPGGGYALSRDADRVTESPLFGFGYPDFLDFDRFEQWLKDKLSD
jgi:hypothetical protein